MGRIFLYCTWLCTSSFFSGLQVCFCCNSQMNTVSRPSDFRSHSNFAKKSVQAVMVWTMVWTLVFCSYNFYLFLIILNRILSKVDQMESGHLELVTSLPEPFLDFSYATRSMNSKKPSFFFSYPPKDPRFAFMMLQNIFRPRIEDDPITWIRDFGLWTYAIRLSLSCLQRTEPFPI